MRIWRHPCLLAACSVAVHITSGCRTRAAAPPPAPVFTEVTRSAGIDFVHDNGAFGEKYYPERMGGGAACFDANGDDWPDLFLVNGAPLPGHPEPQPQPSRLYINRGDGTFTDRTAGSGLETIGYGMGVAAGDVDNDGDADLFVSRLGRSSLFLNRGDGTFTDGTARAGLGIPGYSTSAAFLDYDRDGLLDLYVCRYIPWNSPKDDYLCRSPAGGKQYCSVHVYPGLEHRLFRNLGGARFEDVSRRTGIADHTARGLAVVCGDYDRDGDTDLFVANDETPNFLWRNEGGDRFTEAAGEAGFAYNEQGISTAGMGLDIADVDGNGTDDVIESDFQGQRKTLYVGDGRGFFTANGENKGLGDMPVNRLGFGIGFLDFDLDGWPDIFIANGHVNDDIEKLDPSAPFQQTAQLFRNLGGGRFEDASAGLGEYGRTPRVGRGTAFGDIDNDGDVDLLVVNNGQPAVLLRNDSPRRNHWVGIRCVGTRCARSAYGTRLTVEAGGRIQSREVRAAASYLSSHDPRVLFGLGSAARIDRLEVRWPDGSVREWRNLEGNRYLDIVEGEPNPRRR